jgi:uncharacterized protein (DUF1810 family)
VKTDDGTMNDDPHDLARFVAAQAGSYTAALLELQAGRKASHWMWYVFPQAEALGHSAMSRRYAIRSLDEACAYLDHPLLGARLRECTHALLAHPQRSAREIMGTPDDLKLLSSMTLFAAVPGADPVFARVLDVFFAGGPDTRTLDWLGRHGGATPPG